MSPETKLWQSRLKALYFHNMPRALRAKSCSHPGSISQAYGSCIQHLASVGRRNPLPISSHLRYVRKESRNENPEVWLLALVTGPLGCITLGLFFYLPCSYILHFQFVNEEADMIHLPCHSALKRFFFLNVLF